MDDVFKTTRQHSIEEPLRFTGSGGEYFKIWIVNLLLTIVTLGIYSAWAKVRRLQYFYRHTELASSSFDFHGRPVRILIGRIVALVMFSVYNYTVRLQSMLTILVVLLLAVILPLLLRNSLRFRLYNTSWRGTRFHFRGSVGGIYRVILLNGFLSVITLPILAPFAPFAHQRLKAYQHDNSWFGQTKFSFHAKVGQFYLTYLALLGGVVVAIVVAALAGVGTMLASMGGQPNKIPDLANTMRFLGTVWAITLLLVLSVGPIFHALLTNLIWSNTRLGDHRIECAMSPWGLLWIAVSNFVLTVVTLGFFYPWATVRLARFQLEAIQFYPAGDLQEFQEAEPEEIGAIGEEAASVFDFDISL